MRAIDQQGAGGRGDARGDIGGVDAKGVFRAHRHGHHLGATGTEHRLVGHIHRFGDQHFIPRVENTKGRAKHCALGTCQDRDGVGIDRLAATLPVVVGDGLAQRTVAAYRGVVRMPSAQAGHSGLHHGHRGIEIRVAH